jgi:phage terminase small subunit
VRQFASDGQSGAKIAAWLASEHGVNVTARAVQRFLKGRAEVSKKVAVSETKGLTGRQVRFIEEYLQCLNATQAARKAGYSERSAAAQGAELLKNPKVRAALDRAIENRAIRVGVKADDVLGELLRLARVDIAGAYDEKGQLKPIHEIPEDIRRAIAGVDVEQLFEGRGKDRVQIGNLVKVRFWDKVRGLELLGKHLRLFDEKQAGGKDSTDGGVVVLPAEGE